VQRTRKGTVSAEEKDLSYGKLFGATMKLKKACGGNHSGISKENPSVLRKEGNWRKKGNFIITACEKREGNEEVLKKNEQQCQRKPSMSGVIILKKQN